MDIFKEITLMIATYRSENLFLKNHDILKKFKEVIVDNSNSIEFLNKANDKY